jgi:hypothetical protein
VFQYDNGVVTELASYPVSYPIEVVWYRGSLYCGAARFAEGSGPNKIYRWTGSAWTLAVEYTPTATAGIDFLSGATFKDKAYFGTGSDKTINPPDVTTRLVRLDSSDDWSDNLAPFTAGRVAALYAYNGEMYLTRATDRVGGAFEGGQIYRSSDGVTWTLDKDWATDVDVFVCLRVFASKLWALLYLRNGTFQLWSRNSGGTWAQVTLDEAITTFTMFAL